MSGLDFDGLNARLLPQIRDLVSRWLPGGVLKGSEWCCGSNRGEPGNSFRVNINTGKWAEFSWDAAGGDLISLFSHIQGISNGDAFRQLSDDTSFQAPIVPATLKLPEVELCAPPSDQPAPSMEHVRYGFPVASWAYKDAAGSVLFYIARYATSDGKQIVPWSWLSTGRWIAKGWSTSRPLFKLDQLAISPTSPCLIVEGERCAEAAQKIVGNTYICLTWSGGSNAYKRTDWTPLYERKLLLWADADMAGIKAMKGIAEILSSHCPEIKILDVMA